MSTFQERLKKVLGPRGYSNCMRRSVQTVLLYEAHRCLAKTIDSLRPFQRKAALMDQAQALLESLDFINPYQKSEVFWRTATSKEVLTGDIAHRRIRNIKKELEDLCVKIQPFLVPGRSHNEAVNLLVQDFFVKTTKDTERQAPMNWEHGHNHVITAFRLYYKGDKLDPTFPPPVSPRELQIPVTRPRQSAPSQSQPSAQQMIPKPAASGPFLTAASSKEEDGTAGDKDGFVDVAALLGEKNNPAEERRRTLQEVREHLELLKEFEGVISEEEIAKRKKELFMALPTAPPANYSKKPRMAPL